MKKLGKAAIGFALVLSLALVLAACSSGGGGGKPADTPITTTGDGTKAAAVSKSVAVGMAGNALSFSEMGSGGGFATFAPRLKKTPLFKDAKPTSRAVVNLSKKMLPLMKKAKAMATTQNATLTIGYDCDNFGAGTMDFVIDDMTGAGYFQYTNCRLGTEIFDGRMSWPAMNPNATTITFTVGQSNTSPFTVTSLDWDLVTPLWVDTTYMTMTYSFSGDGISTFDETMTLSGWVQEDDSATAESWRSDVSGFTIRVATAYDAEPINSVLYDVYTIYLNGTWTDAYYASGYSPTATATWSETQTFYNLALTYKNYWLNNGTRPDYFAIDGSVTLSSTPVDACIDGTYTFVTVTDIAVDVVTGMTTAGHLTINSTVDVVFNANGTVTVTVSGTPVDVADLDAVCPI